MNYSAIQLAVGLITVFNNREGEKHQSKG